MSWFSAVTGKAEDLLNRLDKTAASALHSDEVSEKPPPPPEPTLVEPARFSKSQHSSETKPLSPSHSVPARLHHLSGGTDDSSSFSPAPKRGASKSQTRTKTASDAGPKKKNSDDALFDFLNSTESPESGKRLRTPVSSRHHSRQSSTSSIVSSTSKVQRSDAAVLPDSELSSADRPITPSTGAQRDMAPPPHLPPPEAVENATATHISTEEAPRDDSPTTSHASADVAVLADAMKESPVPSDGSRPDSENADAASEHNQRQLSSLELENRLLRNEVASLNDEMAGLISRSKEAQAERSRLQAQLAQKSSSASQHDQMVRELQNREADLAEALKAKDAQLAVLRVRLDEADRRLHAREATLEEAKLERDRILQDHSDSSGMHGQALDAMKLRLEEFEVALRREQEAYRQAQQEANERQARMEKEQQSMAEALRTAERKASKDSGKHSDLVSQMKAAQSSASAAKKELAEYKDKATRILQSKEKLISSLRVGGAGGGEGGVSSVEHEAVRQERDLAREELAQARVSLEAAQMELQEVESQLHQESASAQDTISSLEASLTEEKRRREDAEGELLRQRQEHQMAMEDLSRQKSAFQTRINSREEEIEKLRNQLMTKSMSSSTEYELEARVRTLTESLIHKQTVVEALGTEKNSLVLQLERMESQYRDLENATPRPSPSSQYVAVNDHETDVKQRLPLFLREVPTDHEVTRRMKRAANSIDIFSMRMGVFLRRYPMARIFVIVYMCLLHFWVLVVMMTYQPEMHGMDYQPQPPSD